MQFNLFLSQLFLFKHCSEPQIERLSHVLEMRAYQKGEKIFSENQPASYLYVVFIGQVKIFKLSSDGKEQILMLAKSKDIFAEAPVFEGENYPAFCEAIEDTQLLLLSRQNLLGLIKEDPKIALNMLAIQAKRLRELTQTIENITLRDSQQRLIHYLLANADEYQRHPNFSITQLAKLLSMTRENLSKLLNKLAKQKLININNRQIILLAKDQLKNLEKETS